MATAEKNGATPETPAKRREARRRGLLGLLSGGLLGTKSAPPAPEASKPPLDELLVRRAARQTQVLELHKELVQSLEWSADQRLSEAELDRELRPFAVAMVARRLGRAPSSEQSETVDQLMSEVVGLGPLDPLLADEDVCDVLVNGPFEVFVERGGRLARTEARFADDAHLIRIIQRVAARVGRRVDESSPMVDARLPDGSRVHAIVPPLALRGPTMSIRRFSARPLTVDNLTVNGSLLQEMVAFLVGAIDARVSFLISGGTGAGKTTLLNALSAFIPPEERLVTIEDTAELRLLHPHVVSLETRTANTEGQGAIPPRELLRNSLRMRPDRIIVGEVRGPEAFDMLQAMNSGHEGSLTTIHANDTGDALSRLEMMIGMAGFDFPVPVVRQYVAAGIKLIVHVARLKGGLRRVTRMTEILGVENGEYQLADIFLWDQTGIDSAGRPTGEFVVTGHVPHCLARLRAQGVAIDEEMFAVRRIVVGAASRSTGSATAAARASTASASVNLPAVVDLAGPDHSSVIADVAAPVPVGPVDTATMIAELAAAMDASGSATVPDEPSAPDPRPAALGLGGKARRRSLLKSSLTNW